MRTRLGIAICALVAFTATAAEVGKPSPPLNIQGVSGAPAFQPSQYKGKVVAMAIMLTTCPHCQNLMKVLSAVSKDYAAKGVQVVGCAMNDDAPQLLPAFIQQFDEAKFPVGYCNRNDVLAYVQYSVLQPFYVPHMIFLDKKGIVRGDYKGESDFMTNPDKNIRAELDQLLKGTATTSAAKPTTTAAAAPKRKE